LDCWRSRGDHDRRPQSAGESHGDQSQLCVCILSLYDVAIEGYKRAVANNYRLYLPYAYWAAPAAMKGDDAEAKWALGEAKGGAPDLTITWLKARTPVTEFVVQGLRKAGLAEE
jgi:hypothetical protein